jgi:hypothetical protein
MDMTGNIDFEADWEMEGFEPSTYGLEVYFVK